MNLTTSELTTDHSVASPPSARGQKIPGRVAAGTAARPLLPRISDRPAGDPVPRQPVYRRNPDPIRARAIHHLLQRAAELRHPARHPETGLVSTLVCLALGFPLALAYTHTPPAFKPLVMFLIILPQLTSSVVRTFAWIVILGRQGIINNTLLSIGLSPVSLLYTTTGVVIALAQIQLPLMVLPLINALSAAGSTRRSLDCAGRQFVAHLPQDHAAPEHSGGLRGLPARVHDLDLGLCHPVDHRRRPADLHAEIHLQPVHGCAELAVCRCCRHGSARHRADRGHRLQPARAGEPSPRGG